MERPVQMPEGYAGKPAYRTEGMKWSELRVAKHAEVLSRKAAIVPYVPVP